MFWALSHIVYISKLGRFAREIARFDEQHPVADIELDELNM